ncbi:hypothetical protein C1646_774220 [Rhizophagus diaphanus]|nr:hypothetical protein C1646_774220 [Rhizophagus diaphanus] [Rhizophagus sp. MUCL 43196]
MKAFCDASIQNRLVSKAEYYRNEIDDRITAFITQIGKAKKGWLSRGSVATFRKVTTTKRVMDLLNIAENKGPESRDIMYSKTSSIPFRNNADPQNIKCCVMA